MPRRDTYVPKHRGAPVEPALKKGVRKSVLYSGVAVAATGLAVSSGILAENDGVADSASAALTSANADRSERDPVAVDLSDREQTTSRSADRRTTADALAEKGLDQRPGGQATRTEDLSSQDPRDIARALLPQYGFSAGEFDCLDSLYVSESDWDVHADNPYSSAYGIPQALPGSKMASAGPNWEDDAATQIRWGLEYIRDSYGTPCAAWSFKQSHNWY